MVFIFTMLVGESLFDSKSLWNGLYKHDNIELYNDIDTDLPSKDSDHSTLLILQFNQNFVYNPKEFSNCYLKKDKIGSE